MGLEAVILIGLLVLFSVTVTILLIVLCRTIVELNRFQLVGRLADRGERERLTALQGLARAPEQEEPEQPMVDEKKETPRPGMWWSTTLR